MKLHLKHKHWAGFKLAFKKINPRKAFQEYLIFHLQVCNMNLLLFQLLFMIFAVLLIKKII